MNTELLVDELLAALRAVGNKTRASGAKAYLKSDLEFVGVAAKPLRTVGRQFLDRHPELDRRLLIEVARGLWQRPIYELRAVAVALLEARTGSLELADLVFVEELLRCSHTWALVDWLCTKVAAPLVEGDPEEAVSILRRWSRDGDFWIRRASMLSQLPMLRAGRGDFSLFADFAETMLHEREFFIRKAIGWILRDVSKKRPQLTYGFLEKHIHQLSALTFREGARRLTEDQQAVLRELRNG